MNKMTFSSIKQYLPTITYMSKQFLISSCNSEERKENSTNFNS